jgi:hypothetical protein
MVVGFCGGLLFLFVPESFWDRTPVPKSRRLSKNGSRFSLFSHRRESHTHQRDLPAGHGDGHIDHTEPEKTAPIDPVNGTIPSRPALAHRHTSNRVLHVGFAPDNHQEETGNGTGKDGAVDHGSHLSERPTSPSDVDSPGKATETEYST